MLDDAVAEFFEEKPEYTILYGWDNVKMLLMVVATLVAAASHFFKSPTISERVIVYSGVAGCVFLSRVCAGRVTCSNKTDGVVLRMYVGRFFFIQALIMGYAMLVEKDTILRLSKKVRRCVSTGVLSHGCRGESY